MLMQSLGFLAEMVIGPKLEDHPQAFETAPFEHNSRLRHIIYDKPPIKGGDALEMELKNFIRSVQGKELPIVSGLAGRDALDIALQIQEIIIRDID